MVNIPAARVSAAETVRHLAEDTPARPQQVWWTRNNPGQEVLDLVGEPGVGGRMPALNSVHCAKQDEDGIWVVNTDGMYRRLEVLGDQIRHAQYVMGDFEGFLYEPDMLPLYMDIARTLQSHVAEIFPGHDVLQGLYRIPAQSKERGTSHFMNAALAHCRCTYTPSKGDSPFVQSYCKEVDAAGLEWGIDGHHVCYFDAYSRRTGEPYDKESLRGIVTMTREIFGAPQLVLRQAGIHVRSAILMVRDLLQEE